MSEFYDENAELLNKKARYTERLLWLKIQHCYELWLGYSHYEEDKEEIMQHLEKLTKRQADGMKVIKELTERVERLEVRLKEAEKP